MPGPYPWNGKTVGWIASTGLKNRVRLSKS